MDFGTFVSWVVVGLLAGWLTEFVMKGRGYGLLGDLFLGACWTLSFAKTSSARQVIDLSATSGHDRGS